MDKEEALRAITKEGYVASIENSILMVAVPSDLAGENADAFYGKLRDRFKALGYDASWGISCDRRVFGALPDTADVVETVGDAEGSSEILFGDESANPLDDLGAFAV